MSTFHISLKSENYYFKSKKKYLDIPFLFFDLTSIEIPSSISFNQQIGQLWQFF